MHVKKGLVVLMYAALIAAALFYKEELLRWLGSGDRSDLPLMLLLSVLLAFVPVVPFGVVGGIMGAKYGFVIGGLLNLAGSSIAAVLMLLLVRVLFRDQGRRYLTRFRSLERFTALYEKRPFLSVLAARLIPILPSPAINIYSGLSRISVAVFAAATVLGKVPVMLVFALVGDTFLTDPIMTAAALAVYAVFLAVVYAGYKLALRGQARPAGPTGAASPPTPGASCDEV
ncbi:TVP38/TMEM64 family protein [Paenibacillus puerhi]|uniref:TVP38/TMEM64 family protein n=1 Tax=Paenibacillus puerhi TaxID=2692622 RepID=UPI001359E58F|nr:VTT domain-containing protein [Paenibacillus puerhi]